jgi:ubiquinone biosynthesis protein
MDLKRDFKDVRRFEEILLVFFEEGLGYYLTKTKLHLHLPFFKRLKVSFKVSNKKKQAIRLRTAFERLGPTFVKLGQLLSLRPDLVPKEFSKEFEKLQDAVPHFPYNQVRKIIENNLGKPLNQIFKSFEKKPIASASIAQVHKATLMDGKIVAVKVQRPKIKETIDADLDILFFLAKELEKHFPKLRNYRPLDVVKEFALWTRKEIDFEIEAANAIRLKELMSENNNVKIPKVYSNYSLKKVLTLEFMSGNKINDFVILKKNHINKKKLALDYFTSILEQAFIHGFFHADPHPANIFVDQKGKLIYLDFGIMGELNNSDREKIVSFVESISEKDPEKSLDIVISLAREIRTDDLTDFRRKCLVIMSEAYNSSIKEKSMGRALYEMISLGANYGVIFDPNHVLMAKAVYQAEGLGMELSPDFKVAEGLKIFSNIYLREKYNPLTILEKAKDFVVSNRDLFLDLPDHLVKIIRKLEEEEKTQKVDQHYLQEREDMLKHNLLEEQHKKNISLAVLVLFLASLFFFYAEGYTKIFGIPLSIILISATILLVLYFLFSHHQNRRLD